MLRPESADPASVAVSREGIRLAFIAALQYLSARQRAVLILRDVLGWRAAEVAQLLGTTTHAANGLLQRARAQLRQAAPARDELRDPANPRDLDLLNRYAAAFENADITALTELLRDDAVLEMPPLPALAEYQRGPDGVFQAHGVQVLTVTGSRVARIAAFHYPGLFADFGLPPARPADSTFGAGDGEGDRQARLNSLPSGFRVATP